MTDFFQNIPPIVFEGPETDNEFAFRHYNADEMVADLIKELKAQGLGIFLISHDTREMMDLCDRVSVSAS